MMKTLIRIVLMVGVALPPLVAAHHGTVTNPTLYIIEELVEIEGEVVEVFWRNPHVRFRLDDGSRIWELEMGPQPGLFRRLGVSQDSFSEGGQIRVAGYVSRRNESSLGVTNLLLPSDEEFVEGGQTARWENKQQIDIGYRPPSSQDADPAAVETARATSEGIFKVWAGVGGHRPFGMPGSPNADYSHERLLTEHAREMVAQYNHVDNPELDCRTGMPSPMFDPVPMQIIDDGDRILIRVEEYDVERVVHMDTDGIEAPESIAASPLGFSVGHWEGDSLVVSTTHVDWPLFNNGTGTPQSDQVIYGESFEVIEGDVLRYTFSATDPLMFIEPVVVEMLRGWTPGVAIEPFDCVADW